jgi:cyclopropane-fatty-acyl-phospholipid synthase
VESAGVSGKNSNFGVTSEVSATALRHSKSVLATLFGPPAQRPFDVRYWDGSTDRGNAGASGFTIVITRPGALRRMLLPPSELSIVEAYLSGDVDVEGELSSAVTIGDTINGQLRSPLVLASVMRDLLALPKDDAPVDDVRRARAAHKVTPSGRPHEPKRDRAAIQYHYDVGNDFYQLWLDERMVYSCAYFESPTLTLDQAQEAKLDLVCRKLRLHPGERFLDVGCGWGALVMHAAKHYDVQAVGITLSQQQLALARDRIDAAGLASRCHIELCDYRDVSRLGSFDKVASVGMVEHVGVDHLPGYFSSVHGVIRPGGLFLNHGIVSVEASHSLSIAQQIERKLWRRDAFIDQYVFPDGKLGPFHAVVGAAEGSGFETRDVESLREHYVLTLRDWITRLQSNEAKAIELVGQHTYRVWRLYMTAAAYGFASGRLNVLQTLLSKPRNGDAMLPLTRADLYANQVTRSDSGTFVRSARYMDR